jgi:hypothetical protein
MIPPLKHPPHPFPAGHWNIHDLALYVRPGKWTTLIMCGIDDFFGQGPSYDFREFLL